MSDLMSLALMIRDSGVSKDLASHMAKRIHCKYIEPNKELEEESAKYAEDVLKMMDRHEQQLKEAEKVFKLARHGCECELDNQTCYVCSIAEYFKKYPDSVEKLN